MLLGLCGYLAWAGLGRLADPQDVKAVPLILFAAVGLLANGVSLMILNRSDTGSLNLRGATTEVFADLLGSLLAIAAGVVILITGWQRADPVASLLIAVLILPRALLLLKDAVVVLLEIAPAGLDLDDVRGHLLAMPGRRRRPRPARLDDHQRAAQPLRARHRHRRGAGRRRCRRHARPALRLHRRALRRPARDVPGRARVTPRARGPRRGARRRLSLPRARLQEDVAVAVGVRRGPGRSRWSRSRRGADRLTSGTPLPPSAAHLFGPGRRSR